MLRVRGQWFVMFAVIFSFAVITASVLLSESSKNGILVSTSVFDIPYYELRSLITEMTRAYRCNDWDFKNNSTSLEKNVSHIYMIHGIHINFTDLNVSHNILYMNFTLSRGGVTVYVSKNESKFV